MSGMRERTPEGAGTHYVVATLRPWHVAEFHAVTPAFPGHWHLVTDPAGLTAEALDALAPRYVFFPHWSDKVPAGLLERYECVCFHETDVPYGRGGSPIQNLIVRGHTETVVTALRMIGDFDAGPVYDKRPLSLLGGAEEIYLRAARTVFAMIADIAAAEPVPVPQTGTPTVFARRTPAQSAVPERPDTLQTVFDHIRMLDAPGYPPAFIECGGLRLELSRPVLRTGRIEADVTITLAADAGADEPEG